jgi:hypothetical protein
MRTTLAAAVTFCIPATACDSGSVGRGCPAPLTWTRVPGSPAGTAIAGSAPDDIWLLGTQDGANVFRGDGVHWQVVTGIDRHPATDSSYGESVTGGTVLWVAGPNAVFLGGGFLVVRWDGSTWTSYATQDNRQVSFLWGSGPDDVWGADYAYIGHWDGKTWTHIDSVHGGPLAGGAPGNWWYQGSFFGTPDGGPCPFTPTAPCGSFGNGFGHHAPVGGYDAFIELSALGCANCTVSAAWASSVDDLWFVGDHLFHFDGSKWRVEPSPTTAMLRSIWGTSGSDVWAVGDAGTIVHFDGATWSVVASPTTQNLAGVWASGPRDVWAIGDAVYHATR